MIEIIIILMNSEINVKMEKKARKSQNSLKMRVAASMTDQTGQMQGLKEVQDPQRACCSHGSQREYLGAQAEEQWPPMSDRLK